MSEEQAIYNNGIATTVPDDSSIKCGICGKEAKNAFGLKIHLLSHQPKAPKKRIIPRGKGLRKRAAPIRTEPPAYERDRLTPVSEEGPRPTQPWRPVSQLFSTKIQGMRPRWVRKDLLEKRIEEGWQPRLSDSKNRLEAPEKTIIDGVPLSKYVMKRGMILCDMPEDLAKSREQYYRKISEGGLKANKAELDRETGGQAYGEVKIGKE